MEEKRVLAKKHDTNRLTNEGRVNEYAEKVVQRNIVSEYVKYVSGVKSRYLLLGGGGGAGA